MKYRVEYHEQGWHRAAGDRMVEGQWITQDLGDGRRLNVLLRRFHGNKGPGKFMNMNIEALVEDQWGRRRWRSVQELRPRDIELIENMN